MAQAGRSRKGENTIPKTQRFLSFILQHAIHIYIYIYIQRRKDAENHNVIETYKSIILHPTKGRDLPLGFVCSMRRGPDHEVRNVEIVTRKGTVWKMLDNFLLFERVPRPSVNRLLENQKF